ncbi:MAG: hypothetical protein K8R23_11630 [Chthoniobacter sp.]|nr:hypothetical protein [Chthoniobacter sp.]
MPLFATVRIYGYGTHQSALAAVLCQLAPIVCVGGTAAFFLSRWSPIPMQIRSRCALGLSFLLAVFLCGVPVVGGIQETLSAGAVSAFGLAFALDHIRTVDRRRSVAGWICAIFHAYFAMIAVADLYRFSK